MTLEWCSFLALWVMSSPQDRSELSALALAPYVWRIWLTQSVSARVALAGEITRRFPDDEAAPWPWLVGVMGAKAARLAGAN